MSVKDALIGVLFWSMMVTAMLALKQQYFDCVAKNKAIYANITNSFNRTMGLGNLSPYIRVNVILTKINVTSNTVSSIDMSKPPSYYCSKYPESEFFLAVDILTALALMQTTRKSYEAFKEYRIHRNTQKKKEL